MRILKIARTTSATFCVAACLPSISSEPQLAPSTMTSMLPLMPFQQRARVVPRLRTPVVERLRSTALLPNEHHTHGSAGMVANHAVRPAHDALMLPLSQMSQNGPASTLVSRILQVALGLFVTTMELPPLPPETVNNRTLVYDCDFSTACRWSTVGATSERWRLAHGEPDVLLWLAATGTMVLPSQPFTLIEIRGGTPVDMLSSDVIACQREPSLFGFTYWTIGLSDLEICLLDLHYRQFNCTGMLQSHIQPGKVSLKIPPVKHPFRIAIIPSTNQGILILDDIKYDPKYCGDTPMVIEPMPILTSTYKTLEELTRRPNTLGLSGPTAIPFFPNPTTMTESIEPTIPTMPSLTFMPVVPPFIATSTPLSPFALPKTRMTPMTGIFTMPPPAPLILPPAMPSPSFSLTPVTSTVFPMTAPTVATQFLFVTPKPIVIVPEPMESFFTTISTPLTTQSRTATPFDLMIYGNRTSRFFDRRRNEIVDNPENLICDFSGQFPCLWGPTAGKWAIIEKGAFPSLESDSTHKELPTFPAAVVIQGAAMLTSDPLRCQSGEGKLLFHYWSNGPVLIKVCAMGYNLDNEKTQCVEEMTNSNEPLTVNRDNFVHTRTFTPPAVFTLPNVMHEPFTLNIILIFDKNSHNKFLVLDEITYIGTCNFTTLSEHERKTFGTGFGTPKSSGTEGGGDWSRVDSGVDAEVGGGGDSNSLDADSEEMGRPMTVKPVINVLPISTSTTWPSRFTFPRRQPKPDDFAIESLASNHLKRTTKGTRYPFTTTTPSIALMKKASQRNIVGGPPTTIVYPNASYRRTTTTTRGSFTVPIQSPPPSNIIIAEETPVDYCKLLNCDFNENACNYLNHGMTKVPWTLKNKEYGFPLSKHTDLKTSSSNSQFISALLNPGDFAILESPHFNATHGINVLLFQYYRATHLSAIRLCLGTRYTKPYRTIPSFLQCPPILRSVTSKNALKWNTVHIQLPPGTSHFFLVAHNLERSTEKTAIAIDNIRVAICDSRNYAPPHDADLEALENELNGSSEHNKIDSTAEALFKSDEPPIYSND